jgi:hypothetical protein
MVVEIRAVVTAPNPKKNLPQRTQRISYLIDHDRAVAGSVTNKTKVIGVVGECHRDVVISKVDDPLCPLW